MRARRQYLETVMVRYLGVRKRQKGVLLDEVCRNTGQNRKYIIRKLSDLAAGRVRAPRKRTASYGPEVKKVLVKLWKIYDLPCGQRLSPMIRTDLERLRAFGEVGVSNRTASQLIRISPATIDRLLRSEKEARREGARYGRGGAGLIAMKIPLRMGEWTNVQLGQVDMDLVLHCGSSTAGEFGHSLSTMDVSTEWWEGDVVMGRGQARIFNALQEIESRYPFPWTSIHTDNDSAFINEILYRYAEERGYGFTRSRPYRKNDNAHIEQKNFTHVRKPLGYLRYDTKAELEIIRDLYRNELRLYKNFSQPVMKLARKHRVDGRIKRVYDVPKTPFQRLLESGRLSPEQAEKLKQLYLTLNPADLKRRIDKKLAALYALYHKKNKRTLVVDPYKKQAPSMVTFLMSEQKDFRLPT